MPSYYSDEVIRQVRESNDIVDVISEYITLTRKGGGHFGLCPFHGEKTASFSVNQRDQFFHCFGCGVGGNVFTFLMKMENMTFPEAVKNLAARSGIDLPEAEMSPEEKMRTQRRERLLQAAREAANYYYYQLSHAPENSGVVRYMKKREITDEFRKKFGLGYSPVSRNALSDHLKRKGYSDEELLAAGLLSGKEGSTYDRFFNRLMFPILDTAGRPIAFGGRVMGQGEPKYLNSPDSELFNKRFNLYGLSIAKRTRRDHLLMVEGYMDVFSLHQAGFDNAVASLGTALTREQAVLMKRYTDKVILCYDSDGAGTKAAQRAIPILDSVGLEVKVIQVPGSKDPDEFIKENGAEAFEKVILTAMNPIDFEMKVLEKVNGESVDGRIQTLRSMKEKLAEIAGDSERELHLQDVARRMRIPAATLRQEVEEIRRSTGLLETASERNRRRVDAKETMKERGNAGATLLAILVKRSDVYPYVRNYLSEDDFTDTDPLVRKAAESILEKLNRREEVKMADLISRFESVEDQQKISRLSEYQIPEEKQDLEKYLTQLIRALKQKAAQELMEKGDTDSVLRAVQLQRSAKDLNITL